MRRWAFFKARLNFLLWEPPLRGAGAEGEEELGFDAAEADLLATQAFLAWRRALPLKQGTSLCRPERARSRMLWIGALMKWSKGKDLVQDTSSTVVLNVFRDISIVFWPGMLDVDVGAYVVLAERWGRESIFV